MFATPLGLLALLAVPAIVALHLFRRRFAPREVSALFLWGDEDRTPLSGRSREKLRASASLVLECLAAILLALLLAGPRGCTAGESEHLVAVLDGSASMDARPPHGSSPRERALELVRGRILALPRGSRVTLLQSGTRPRTLAGPAAFPEEALAALGEYRPVASHHELAPAVALGLQLAGGGAVLVATDRFAPEEFPAQVELRGLGEPLDNLSFAGAARAREARGAERVFATVASHARTARRARITLHGEDGSELAPVRQVELAPLAREPLAFDLPAGAGAVELRLETDALAIDDRAFLARRPPRVVGVASELDQAAHAALGLDGRDGTPLGQLLALDDETIAASPESAHLVLAREPRAAWTLVLGPAPANGERKDFVGPFLAERRHPLLEGLTLEGVVWSADPALALPGTPLVSAGNLPLFSDEARGAGRALHLNLDPARSSLARSPDWPILLANLIAERRRELPGAESTNLHAGGTLTWRAALAADDDGAPFTLRGPRTSRQHPARALVVFDGVEDPGFHALERRGVRLALAGVSFQDAQESDLIDRSSGVRAAEVRAAPGVESGSRLELLLIAGVLAAALADWFLLARAARGTQIPFARGSRSAPDRAAHGGAR